MIKLKHIEKSYESVKVLEDFSYTFDDTGFYLLYGRSGSGKTTLINILSGIIDFDQGEYQFYQHSISGKADQDILRDHIAYLTQDAYFIDYLTLQENFELAQVDKDLTADYIKEFHIEALMNRYPNQCSAGQRQRLAIIQALATHKQVLILDEPTASLDKKNKHKIFQLLKKISEKVLVICVSHDAEAKEYCDEVIDFANLNLLNELTFIHESTLNNPIKKERINLYEYVKKMRKNKKKEKASTFCLAIIYAFVILIGMSVYDPETKLINSLGNDYHLNYVNVAIPLDNYDEYITNLKQEYDIQSVIYPYRFGANYVDIYINGNDITADSVAYIESMIYETIPTSNAFYLKDRLFAGMYFSSKNEIMLGYEKALEYTNTPENLIGKSVMIETPKGSEEFIVSGVFSKFTEDEIPYFQNGYDTDALDNVVYFNELYTNGYLDDGRLASSEKELHKGRFILYFNDFEQVMDFMEKEKYCEADDVDCISVYPISDFIIKIVSEFKKRMILLLPCVIIALFMSVLFYGQTKIKELFQNRHIMCVYQYYGYSTKEIMRAYKKYYRYELFYILGISLLLSAVVVICSDIIFKVTKYPLFTINVTLCLGLTCLLFLICYPIVYYIVKGLKKVNWYQMMIERRDLL